MQVSEVFGGRLKLRQLVLLVTIADEGSFVGAATALYISQPAVTRAVRELEEIVGVDLFVRRPRGVSPTVYGEILIDQARAALGNLRRAAQQIDEVKQAGTRPLRVGTNLAGAYSLLPRALVALKRHEPGVPVSVREGTAEELSTALVRSEIDLMVGRLDPSTYRGALHHLRLYDEAVRIVVRRDHPALAEEEPTLEGLRAYPWILPLRPSQLRRELEEVFERQGLPLPADVIECSTMLTMRSILVETDSLAPLPTYVGLRDEELDLLTTELDTVPRAIGVTLPADRSVSAHARLLVDALADVARSIGTELQAEERRLRARGSGSAAGSAAGSASGSGSGSDEQP